MSSMDLAAHPHAARRNAATAVLRHAFIAMLLAAPCVRMGAQSPDLDVALGANATSCSVPGASSGAAAADVRARWPLLRLGVSGVPVTGGGATERSAVVSALTPSWHGLRADGTLRWEAAAASCGGVPSSRTATAQLSWGASRGGFWLGLEAPRRNAFMQTQPADTGESFATWRLGSVATMGAWRRVGPVRLSLGVRAARGTRSWSLIIPHLVQVPEQVFSDSGEVTVFHQVTWSDSVTVGARNTVIDALGRLSFASGRLAAQAAFGTPVRGSGFRLSAWTDVQVAYAVSPWLSLLGSATSQSATSLAATGDTPWRMSLGVRVATLPFSRPHDGPPPPERAGASAFRVLRGVDNSVTISLRAPQADVVELTGDFLNWSSVRMHRTSADWWVASVHLLPGTYHVNVRIDGATWVAPPGLPRQADEFGGSVGVLVVR